MSTIITRIGKGSPLTNIELDSNFTNLNNDKLEISAFASTANAWLSTKTLSDISNVQLTTPINGQALVWNSLQGKWINQTIEGGTGGGTGLEGGTLLASTIGINTFDEFDSTLYSSIKYLLQITSGEKIYFTELTLVHNGVDVFLSEYGSIFTDQLCTFSANFSGDLIQVKATTTIEDTYIDYKRIPLTARLQLWQGDLMLMSGSTDLMTATGSVDLMQ